MLELSIALKYLIPRKKQLSVSLIALLSVAVISLVVWLLLVFLSVTEGIEKGWLKKLTTLNAPLRITPTPAYYSSYYYHIDSLSSSSQFTLKSIAEKAKSSDSDPYRPDEDGQLPPRFPAADRNVDHSLKDPVKELLALLAGMKQTHRDLTFQDYEISGALLRLQLLRPGHSLQSENSQGYLTQVSYLASLPDQCPDLSSLILAPTERDLNHLLYLSSHATELSRQDSPALATKTSQDATQSRLRQLLSFATIQELKPRYEQWQLDPSLLPEGKSLSAIPHYRGQSLIRLAIPLEPNSAEENRVTLRKEKGNLAITDKNGKTQQLSLQTPLLIQGKLPLQVNTVTLGSAALQFNIQAALQNVPLNGNVTLSEFEVSRAEFKKDAPQAPWFSTVSKKLAINEEKEAGVLLAKSFLDNGVMLGDRGYLSYSSTTSSSVQEHRLPIYVAGFYDPGILSIGNKCILVPPFVTQTINASSASFAMDKTQSNGISVWFQDLNAAESIREEIVSALKKHGLDSYWKVTTFREYDFAKDLLQQFQSDRYLFTLVGVIILVVACCNIIALLVLLVNDKKREIGILQAMGASRLSIASIFGLCGVTLGILSSILGIGVALLTLHNIDTIVQMLSFIQGRDAFSTVFFGKSLPNELSHNAVMFIIIATPLLSFLAGLVPAIKACRLHPSSTLRSE